MTDAHANGKKFVHVERCASREAQCNFDISKLKLNERTDTTYPSLLIFCAAKNPSFIEEKFTTYTV